MEIRNRLHVIFHAAIVLLAGLLSGFAAVVDRGAGPRLWLSAHVSLIILGVWMLATAAVLPSLVLPRREAAGLVWSLVLTGYSFMTAVVIEAVTGVRAFQPTGSALGLVAFIGNGLGVTTGLIAGGLTLMGAHAALRQAPSTRPEPAR